MEAWPKETSAKVVPDAPEPSVATPGPVIAVHVPSCAFAARHNAGCAAEVTSAVHARPVVGDLKAVHPHEAWRVGEVSGVRGPVGITAGRRIEIPRPGDPPVKSFEEAAPPLLEAPR